MMALMAIEFWAIYFGGGGRVFIFYWGFPIVVG
jgi:hypothetical protein